MCIKAIKSIINNFPTQTTPSPDELPGEFYQIFKLEIISILYNIF